MLLAGRDMTDAKARLLIVDDEPSIRTSLSLVLIEIGYSARSAADGFSALHEIRQEAPDILISDLNMPGMPGFELLSVVRSQFPGVQTIAMSGAFCGDEVPCGVAADAFYQKGSSIGSLLKIMGSLASSKRIVPKRSHSLNPVQIQSIEPAPCRVIPVASACPERLGALIEPVGESAA
jgi:CheY-like chemotaxis protein